VLTLELLRKPLCLLGSAQRVVDEHRVPLLLVRPKREVIARMRLGQYEVVRRE
jgi:hypothetical protein